MNRLRGGSAAAAILCLLAGACDGGASAVPVERARTSAPDTEAVRLADRPGVAERQTPALEGPPAPEVDGKPMWSSTRRFTARQNARRAFERNGAAFGAQNVEAFVEKAHAFISKPPKGSLTFRRANGDTLIYDPAGNVFAIATREGAPRTMFKPDEGMAYWEEVKAQEAARASAPGRRAARTRRDEES